VIIVPVYTPAPYTPPAEYVPPVTPAPTTPVAGQPLQNDTFYYSLDGTRSIQITGDRNMAMLYDLTAVEADGLPKYLNFLGVGVTEALFQNTAEGIVSSILTIWQDTNGAKQFSLFNANGLPMNGMPQPKMPEVTTVPADTATTPVSVDQLRKLSEGGSF
jgi:hypothetical protein